MVTKKTPHILVKAKDKTTGEILGKSLKVCRALSGDLVLGGEMLLGFFCLFRESRCFIYLRFWVFFKLGDEELMSSSRTFTVLESYTGCSEH